VQDEFDGRSLTDRLLHWGRRASDRAGTASREGAGQAMPTKAFGKFLACLASRESPVLLDLGPVVGPNVGVLGERLGCKLVVEDLFADLDRHAKEGRIPEFAEFLSARLKHPDGSVDGILCWDLLDYLDKASAQVLGRELTRVLKPGGALLGFFATTPPEDRRASYTKFLIVDDTTLEHRSYPAARAKQPVLNNRDITRLFEGLRVAESFLLLTKTREILFRKAA